MLRFFPKSDVGQGEADGGEYDVERVELHWLLTERVQIYSALSQRRVALDFPQRSRSLQLDFCLHNDL